MGTLGQSSFPHVSNDIEQNHDGEGEVDGKEILHNNLRVGILSTDGPDSLRSRANIRNELKISS